MVLVLNALADAYLEVHGVQALVKSNFAFWRLLHDDNPVLVIAVLSILLKIKGC